MTEIETIKWKRPSGTPLMTDNLPATIEYLESLGYEQISDEKKAAPKKKAAKKEE